MELAPAKKLRRHRINDWRPNHLVFGKPDFVFPIAHSGGVHFHRTRGGTRWSRAQPEARAGAYSESGSKSPAGPHCPSRPTPLKRKQRQASRRRGSARIGNTRSPGARMTPVKMIVARKATLQRFGELDDMA